MEHLNGNLKFISRHTYNKFNKYFVFSIVITFFLLLGISLPIIYNFVLIESNKRNTLFIPLFVFYTVIFFYLILIWSLYYKNLKINKDILKFSVYENVFIIKFNNRIDYSFELYEVHRIHLIVELTKNGKPLFFDTMYALIILKNGNLIVLTNFLIDNVEVFVNKFFKQEIIEVTKKIYPYPKYPKAIMTKQEVEEFLEK